MDFSAKRRGGEGDRHVAMQVAAFALENGVLLDVDDDIEIARGTAAHAGFAVAAGAEPRAVLDASGDFQFDARGFFDPTFAATGAAGFLDRAAGALAGRACLRDLEKSARDDDLAAAAAGIARDGLRAGL